MKFAIHTAVLLLLLGATTSAFARQEEKGGEKQETKPEQQAKPAHQAKPTQQAKPAPRQQAQQAKPARQPRTQQAQVNTGNHGGGDHGRISDAHYRASFGNAHSFHVNQGEFNNHRFLYGGYSFGFVQPWPVGWLYSDAVYVDYVDGGYYYVRSHPSRYPPLDQHPLVSVFYTAGSRKLAECPFLPFARMGHLCFQLGAFNSDKL